MIRIFLDALFRWSGYLAAVFLVMISLTVAAQIVGRFFGVAIDSTETGGFSLAATTFFGLAYTLKHGRHIRVTLVIDSIPGRFRRAIDLFCSAAAVLVTGYVSYRSALMAYDSWSVGVLSPGLMAIPVWIPQLSMVIGTFVLTLAFADELWLLATGRNPGYDRPTETALDDPDAAIEAPSGVVGPSDNDDAQRSQRAEGVSWNS